MAPLDTPPDPIPKPPSPVPEPFDFAHLTTPSLFAYLFLGLCLSHYLYPTPWRNRPQKVAAFINGGERYPTYLRRAVADAAATDGQGGKKGWKTWLKILGGQTRKALFHFGMGVIWVPWVLWKGLRRLTSKNKGKGEAEKGGGDWTGDAIANNGVAGVMGDNNRGEDLAGQAGVNENDEGASEMVTNVAVVSEASPDDLQNLALNPILDDETAQPTAASQVITVKEDNISNDVPTPEANFDENNDDSDSDSDSDKSVNVTDPFEHSSPLGITVIIPDRSTSIGTRALLTVPAPRTPMPPPIPSEPATIEGARPVSPTPPERTSSLNSAAPKPSRCGLATIFEEDDESGPKSGTGAQAPLTGVKSNGLGGGDEGSSRLGAQTRAPLEGFKSNSNELGGLAFENAFPMAAWKIDQWQAGAQTCETRISTGAVAGPSGTSSVSDAAAGMIASGTTDRGTNTGATTATAAATQVAAPEMTDVETASGTAANETARTENDPDATASGEPDPNPETPKPRAQHERTWSWV